MLRSFLYHSVALFSALFFRVRFAKRLYALCNRVKPFELEASLWPASQFETAAAISENKFSIHFDKKAGATQVRNM